MKLIKIFILFLMCSCLQNTPDVSKLSQIPEEDRAKIEKLLSFLVWDEGFAYVLFGNKPMSRVSQEKQIPSYYMEAYQSPIYELESLWKTWEKYAHLFPMKEFVFLTENDERLFSIYLLNKSNCLKIIENNLALFQRKTFCNLNAFEMFDYIVANAGDNIYKNSLNKSQALTGILFGYGTENATGFEDFFSVKRGPLPPESRYHIEHEDSVRPFIPFFSSFSVEETQSLIADYQQQRQEILKIYSNKDFLETTINQLIMQR
jgi:hypothetical protein